MAKTTRLGEASLHGKRGKHHIRTALPDIFKHGAPGARGKRDQNSFEASSRAKRNSLSHTD
eukprot:7524909-Lingulodinium_polyedra.AAC.1